MKIVIFLSGPVGVGKSTLGQRVATALGGKFIEGDDYSDPNKRWYCTSLSTSRLILAASLTALQTQSPIVVAYPIRRTNWIFYQRHLAEADVVSLLICLRASHASITSDIRGRSFSETEKHRTQTMIDEGYGERTFSHAVVATDEYGFDETVAELATKARQLMNDFR